MYDSVKHYRKSNEKEILNINSQRFVAVVSYILYLLVTKQPCNSQVGCTRTKQSDKGMEVGVSTLGVFSTGISNNCPPECFVIKVQTFVLNSRLNGWGF